MKLSRPKPAPLKIVEPFERILRALFISQCPYKFSSFLDLKNASERFRLFSRDFQLFRFFFPGSACFSTLASPQNLPSWVKYYEKFESFGKEFQRTKFIAVRGLDQLLEIFIEFNFFDCIGAVFKYVRGASLTLGPFGWGNPKFLREPSHALIESIQPTGLNISKSWITDLFKIFAVD